MAPTLQDIKHVLHSIPKEGLFQLSMLKDITLKEGILTFIIEIPSNIQPQIPQLQHDLHQFLRDIQGIKEIKFLFTTQKPMPPLKKPSSKIELSHIKNIIAIASGKGGVGKSTTATYLALILKKYGLKVGLLDADLYGPSIPQIFQIQDKPEMKNGRLIPLQKMGITLMSIGFLIDPRQPLIWRGPMIQTALKQLLRDVAWGELDVLLIDMPPGTGDAQLTLAQSCPLTGAIIVTTPQDLALIDAAKGLEMFKRMDIPIFGIIENMSLYECPHCHHISPIFGEGGASKMAHQKDVPVLGKIPLDMAIRISTEGQLEKSSEKIAFYYQPIGKALLGMLK